MAKLSARGRTCQVSMVKEENVTDSEAGVIWRRTTNRLMSDGHILQKLDVKFKPIEGMEYLSNDHTYGWKDKGKAGEGITADKFRDHFIAKGYIEVK